MDLLLEQIRACKLCEPDLALGANPVVQAAPSAKLLIIGQAPGTKVHQSGIPWNDPSGNRLREWLQIDPERFYDPQHIAIMPMGFCYPGKGKSGDLPPRPECAEKWHQKLMDELPNIELILLIGQYAQKYYLKGSEWGERYQSLTDRVKHANSCPSPYFVLPHPSPRNRHWMQKNAWFESETLPLLRAQLNKLDI